MKKIISIVTLCTIFFYIFSINIFLNSVYAALPAPGGIDSNLELWLKADTGVITTGISNVDTWNDLSGNANNFASQSLGAKGVFSDNVLNFNPVITYDGNSGLQESINIDNRSMFIVYKHTSTGNWELPFGTEDSLVSNGLYHGDDNGHVYNSTWTPSRSLNGANFVNGKIENLLTHVRPQNHELHTRINTVDTSGPGLYYISSDRGIGGRGMTGEIAEIIVYSSDIAAQKQQIESYLAIKYGITLDSSVVNYVNSSGSLVYGYDGVYEFNIFGIAKDINSSLDQRISKSINSGSILTFSTDTNFVNANTSHADILTNGQYFVVGSNNASLGTQITELDTINYINRITREWKSINTSGVGTVNMKFDGFNDSYVLLSDNDGDFSSGVTNEGALNPSGEISLTLSGTKYFTLARINNTPVITLTGSGTITQEVGGTYTDAGATASDTEDGDISGDITSSGSVNAAVVGTYTIDYDVSDSSGNAATTVTRTVNIVDTTAPVITELGTDPVSVVLNGSYSDAGATCSDNYDASCSVTSTGSVDTSTIGVYTITYNAVDAAGNNATSETRTVNVVAGNTPVITLTGSGTITQEVGGTYTDAGATASDTEDGDISGDITSSGSVNAAVVGTYTIDYDVSDSSGNAATTVTRTVNIVDTTAPVITELGTDPVSVVLNGSYSDAGATCSDNYDASCSVTSTGSVDTSTIGVYTITYNAVDAAGNNATSETRTVNVVAGNTPVITLTGSGTITQEVGGTYTDAGATASDTEDGDISGDITSSGSVNAAVVGTYTIDYDVSDSSGNAATTVTRTVNIVDTTAPVITELGTDPVSVVLNGSYSDAGATCSDNYDASCSVTSTGSVDTSTIGVYTITYNAVDAAGNNATSETRTVNVVAGNTPVITLTGSGTITQEVGGTYTDAGATASDTEDGDISGDITSSGSVNAAVVGTYTIDYDVSDSSGNAATTVTRTVNILDTTAPSNPTVGTLSPNPAQTGNTVTLPVTNVEEGSTVTIPGLTCTPSPADATGVVSCTGSVTSGLLDGSNNTITVTDPSGNTNTNGSVPILTIDDTAPTDPTTSTSPSPAKDGTVITTNLTNVEEGSTVSVPGMTCTPSPATASGTVSCTGTVGSGGLDGTDTTVTVTDPAGNTNTNIDSGLVVDNTAPSNPTVGTLSPNPAQTGNTVTLPVTNVEEGSTVTIPGLTCTPSPADATGVVSCTGSVTSGLLDGSNNTITVTDPSGNTNTNGSVPILTIDDTAPTDPTTSTSPSPAKDGTVITTNLTNVEEGSTVSVPGMTCTPSPATASGTVSCTGTVGSGGLDGTDTTVTVTDPAGNTNTNIDSGLVVDNTAPSNPTVGTLSPNPAQTGNTVTLPVTNVEEGSTVTIPGLTCTPSPADATGVVSCTGSVTSGLLDGSNNTITVTDPSGNTNTNGSVPILTIDDTAPTDPTTSTSPSPAKDGTVITTNLTNVEEGSTVSVPGMTCTPSPATASGTVSCTGTVGSGGLDGTDTTVTVTDPAGNTNTNIDSGLVVDNTAPSNPTVGTLSPNPAQTGNTVTLPVTNVEEGSTVTIPGLTCTPSPADATGVVSCTGSVTSGLLDGSNNTITVTDPSGNTNTNGSVPILTIDDTAPTDPTTSTSPSPAKDGTVITTNLTNVEEGSTVSVPGMTCTPSPATASGTVSCTGTVGSGGLDGTDTTVTVTDPAGNTNTNIDSGLVVDNTAPSNPTVTSVGGDTTVPYVTSDTTPDAVFIAEVGSTVTITGWTCSPTPVTANGSVTCTPDSPLGEGVNTGITPTITDAAGNATAGTPFDTTVDTTAPTSPVITEPTSGLPINGTGEIGAMITVTTPSGSTCTTTVQADGLWSCMLSPNPSDGETVSVTQTDSVGNTSTPATTIIDEAVDTDGDGVPDIIEQQIGTNPNDNDSDNDGTNDGNNDGDNVSPMIELGAINNGDGNNDGTLDAIQNDVSSLPNLINTRYNTLELSNTGTTTCSQINYFANKTETSLGLQDGSYNYNLGLWDFEINCSSTGATADIKIYLDTTYDTSSWVYRKHNEATNTYTDISSIVTYTTEAVGTTPVTVINYQITDGEIYDEDGLANGVIIDPSGPAVPIVSSSSSSGGGGGGGSGASVPKDVCPHGDTTRSNYDGRCEDNPEEQIQENIDISIEGEGIKDKGDYSLTDESCLVTEKLLSNNYMVDYMTKFKDISLSAFKKEIIQLEKIKIVTGRGDGIFDPESKITRAEFLAIVLQAHCYDISQKPELLPFYDVEIENWQSNVVKTGLEYNIIAGDKDASGNRIFRPNDSISKIEAFAILMNMRRLRLDQELNNFQHSYSDVIAQWQHEYLNTGEALGILVPQSTNNIFSPNTKLSREELVGLMFDIMELY